MAHIHNMSGNHKYFFRREDNKELIALTYDEWMEKGDWEHNGRGRTFIICEDEVKAYEIEDDEERKLNSTPLPNYYEKDNTRYSYSLGCRPSQLKEMQKLHPGARFVKKGHGYVMEIRNRADKKRRMKERGFIEFDKHTFDD